MQIAAGICTYASSHLLKRCLESMKGLTDLNIVIHGRFRGFPNVMPYSESVSATIKAIEDYSNITFVEEEEPVDEEDGLRTQAHHRNRYLEIARKEGIEWLIVVDDDEYVIRPRTDVQKVRHNLESLRRDIDSQPERNRFFLYNVASVQTEDEELPTRYVWYRPRMMYEPGYFQYLHSAHYHLRDPIGRIYKGHPGHSLIQDLYFRHDQDANDAMRLAEYMDAKRKYMQWQRINESDS